MFHRHSTLALCAVTLLLQPFAYAQATAQIIPTNLPQCAETCPLLQNALTSCEANPASAATCFCQSALLTPVKTTTTNICAPQCADADFATIRTWFQSYCSNPANPGGGQNAANGGATVVATATTTTANTPTDQAAPAASTTLQASYLESEDLNKPESGSEWWSKHWEWVLMVIILVVAFTAIGVGGSMWYKKRKRTREGWNDPRPDMATWAPSQHNVHDFGSHAAPIAAGTAAAMPAAARGKGKTRASTSAPPASGQPVQNSSPSKGSKLKKVLGRN